MGKTPRERLLLMLLPALVAVGGYVLLYSRDKELTAAQEGLAAARKSAVSPLEVRAALEKVGEANLQLAEIKKQKSDLETRWTKLGAIRDREPHDRNHAVKEVSRIFRDCGLHSIDETVADDNSGELPPSFQAVLTQLNDGKPQLPGRRMLKMRVVGRYADVLEALELLRDSGSSAVPIGVSMSEIRADTPYRSWTLVLWI